MKRRIWGRPRRSCAMAGGDGRSGGARPAEHRDGADLRQRRGPADPRHAIREFIIGTGGEGLDTLTSSTPNLQAGTDQFYGTMKLALAPSGYRCDFGSALESLTAPAGTAPSYSDTGSQRCHSGGREY